jgi:predicted  nucleic acid-binding Zn-ribbon protein
MYKECTDCGEEFRPGTDKPGLLGQCYRCGARAERERDVVKLGGNMIYEHKTGGYIEVKPMAEARAFNRATRRLGAGVTRSIAVSKLRIETEEFGGDL